VSETGKVFFNSNHAVHRMHFSQEGLKLVSLRLRYIGTLEEVMGLPGIVHGN